MLPRQPLRHLLADDPGAGKTIMAGLLIKELMIRGDVARCLIVAPGSLVDQWQVDQWQDELADRFNLHFEILTRDMIEATRSHNPFAERPLLIARLDHLSRNEELQAKAATSDDWDLLVVDEAHKMSATYYGCGGERRETKRYKLGKLLGGLTRHLLLMTATPHNSQRRAASRRSWPCSTMRPVRGQAARRRPRGRHVRPDAPPPHHPAAPAGVVTRGDLPVDQPSPEAPRGPPGRGAHAQAGT